MRRSIPRSTIVKASHAVCRRWTSTSIALTSRGRRCAAKASGAGLRPLQCGFLSTPTVVPQVKSGKLIGLAVTSARRSPMELPTMGGAGIVGLDRLGLRAD
jgi:hypothetical protein